MSRITFAVMNGPNELHFDMGWDPALKTAYIGLMDNGEPVVGCNSQLESISTWLSAGELYTWLMIQSSEVSGDLGVAVQEALHSDLGACAFAELRNHINDGCRCGRPSADYECERCAGISNAWVNVVSEGNVPA